LLRGYLTYLFFCKSIFQFLKQKISEKIKYTHKKMVKATILAFNVRAKVNVEQYNVIIDKILNILSPISCVFFDDFNLDVSGE
jgi:hypothetical protein